MGLYIFIAVVFVILIAALTYVYMGWDRKRRMAESLGNALFLIKIPRASAPGPGSETKDFKSELAHFEQLLAGLSALRRPFAFEIAVPHIGEEIHFYIAVPKVAGETAAKQIQGLWAGASVEPAPDDFNIFNAHGVHVGAYVTQKESYALPIKTYVELGLDSFESIVGAFAKINEIGEGAALQMILQPASSSYQRDIRHAIERMKKGEPFKKAIAGASASLFSANGVTEVFAPKSDEEKAKEKEQRVVDDEAVKALQSKIGKPLFEVKMRLLASAGSQFQANDILDGLAAGFSQFGAASRNEFRIVKPRNTKNIINEFIYRAFDGGDKMVLSSEEIASIYHFPISSTETPRRPSPRPP